MPEISVIIPTYQHGDTIASCLDSVFKQTIFSVVPAKEGNDDILEVIVINDGSTDETEEAIKPYLDKINYKKIENSGAPKARNVGFAMSHGRFVIFLDADIIMKQEMLQTLYDALKNHPGASYAYGGFRFGIARFCGEKFDAERLRRINFIHTSALIRRDDFYGFDESLKRFQDWDLWLTMLEKGKVGVGVDKILFAAKPHGRLGYSQWRPKIFFSPFFAFLGIRFKSVEKYRAAAAIIAVKHSLRLPNPTLSYNRRGEEIYTSLEERLRKYLWLGFLAVFAVSAISFGHPWVGTIVSLVFLALALVASLNQLVYGVGAILAELIFGSLAGKTLALNFFGMTMPLRIALFAIVGGIWLVRILQGRVRLPSKNILIGVAIMLLMVGWGITNGLLHGIGFKAVFSDANAYLALPLVLFFISAVKNEADQAWLKNILKHGVIALSILTIIALYFFSHKFVNEAGVFAYKWLRDSRIAEITALDNGTYRIFIQSQIFCLLAFIMIAFGGHSSFTNKKRGVVPVGAWGIWPATALIISASRSFVLGLVAAGVMWLVLIIMQRHTLTRPSATLPLAQGGGKGESRLGTTAWKIAIFAIAGFVIFFIALKFPFPEQRSQTSFQDMLISKNTSQRDAAVTSRWSLLKELNNMILKAPILGSGFGATVTYESSDPRIVSTTGGSYTTAAFEWNYHDIVIKMGLFGLLAYGFLLWAIFRALWRSDDSERRWLIPAFFALIVLNAVSPFLNHPLGIGYLAMLLALAERKRGEVAPVVVTELIKLPSRNIATAPGLAMSASLRHPEAN